MTWRVREEEADEEGDQSASCWARVSSDGMRMDGRAIAVALSMVTGEEDAREFLQCWVDASVLAVRGSRTGVSGPWTFLVLVTVAASDFTSHFTRSLFYLSLSHPV